MQQWTELPIDVKKRIIGTALCFGLRDGDSGTLNYKGVLFPDDKLAESWAMDIYAAIYSAELELLCAAKPGEGLAHG